MLKQLSSTTRMDAHLHLLTLLFIRLSVFEVSWLVDRLESNKIKSSIKGLDVSDLLNVLNTTLETNGF
jgi:hypothetical protein